MYSVEGPKEVYQMEYNNKFYFPPEIMEKIICNFDGKTLLKYKSLSSVCNDIANNATRYYNPWNKICLKEIPKNYFVELLNKHFSTFVPYESLSEIQYERLYKHWDQWQSTAFNVTRIGQQDFLGLDKIKKIICHKFDVMIVFTRAIYTFTLIKNEEKTKCDYVLKEKKSELSQPHTMVMLNPRPQTIREGEELNLLITCFQQKLNLCPLHVANLHDGNNRGHYIGQLIDVDTNIYANACCWVRETWFEWHSHFSTSTINGHHCRKLANTMFTSVVHGINIGRINTNNIVVHNMFKDLCLTVNSWMHYKYVGATAVHIYLNILFIGTQNGRLLAYRLHSWDDLINLKEKNILLSYKLDIGPIVKLDIMDYENMTAIIVASTLNVLWIKVH